MQRWLGVWLGAMIIACVTARVIAPVNLPLFAPFPGIAFAVLSWRKPSEWIAVAPALLGALYLNAWLAGQPIAPWLWPSIVQLLAAGAGALGVRLACGTSAPFESMRTLTAFLAVSALTAMIAAAGTSAAVTGFSIHEGLRVWPEWALAIFPSTIIIGPAILSYLSMGALRPVKGGAIRELATVLLIGALAVLASFDTLPSGAARLGCAFALVPLFTFAAARLDAASLTSALLLIAVIVAFSPMGDGSVIENGSASQDVAAGVHAFLSSLAITAYVVFVSTSANRKTAQSLSEREARLRSIIETVPDALITIDDRGLVESFSPSAVRLFGYAEPEILGKNVSILMPSPYREQHDSYIQRYKDTGEKRIIGIGRIVIGLRKDGTTFPMQLEVGEAHANGRRIFTGFVHDISERQAREHRLQELQAELLHVSRMNDMGQLSGALAHELNQPLTAISNYLQACRHLLQANAGREKVLEVMAKAAKQVDRAGTIIRNLRSFVEKSIAEPKAESLNKIVSEANALALVGAGESNIRTQLQLAQNLPDVFVDRVQIQQVIVNLARNAIDAMAGAQRPGLLVVTTSQTGDGGVQVSVRDSGPGISPDIAPNLFKAFNTSKASGMGLGLSICWSIIENHRGRIWHEPNPQGGAIFSFALPPAGPAGD